MRSRYPDLDAFEGAIAHKRGRGRWIDEDLWARALDFVPDLEIDPLIGEVISAPISDRLGWRYTRFGHRARPTEYAGFFKQFDGSDFQGFLSNPRRDKDSGDLIKYESIKGGPVAFQPPVPDSVRRAIGRRWGQPIPSEAAEPDFWGWAARAKDLPLVLCEGGWKALSLLSAGYLAIGLLGCSAACYGRSHAGKAGQLREPIEALLRGRGRCYIALDQDPAGSKANFRVEQAVSGIARACKALGRKHGPELLRVRWDGALGKGPDDLIEADGVGAFEAAIAAAQPLARDSARQMVARRLTRKPDLEIELGPNEDLAVRLDDLRAAAAGHKAIAIWAPKGAGKSKAIGQLTAGDPILSLTHRVSLARAQCKGFRARYRTEADRFRGKAILEQSPRFTACLDGAIHSFAPHDFAEGWLILDEWEQGARHLLSGGTLGDRQRRAMSWLERAAQSHRAIVAASADLTDWSLNLLESLAGDRPFLIRVSQSRPQWHGKFVESGSATAAIGAILEAAQSGSKLYIASDSRRFTKRLELLLSGLNLRGICLNRDTSGGESEREFLADPDRWIAEEQPDYVIASPTVGSGVSIERPYFDLVGGIFYGSGGLPEDCAQMLDRVRGKAQRVIWAIGRARGGGKFSGRWDAQGCQQDLLKGQAAAARALGAESLSQWEAAGALAPSKWVAAAAEIEAEANRSKALFREYLGALLSHEGKQLERLSPADDPAVREAMRQAREQVARAEALAKIHAARIDAQRAEELSRLESRSTEEQAALDRYRMESFYSLDLGDLDEEAAIDFCIQDGDGRRRGAIVALEQSLDLALAEESDRRKAERIFEDPEQDDPLCPWHIGRSLLRARIRAAAGLDAFLEPGACWDAESEIVKRAAGYAKAHAREIRAALGAEIWGGMSDIRAAHALLSAYDIRICGRKRAAHESRPGAPTREYRLDSERWAATQEIIERRARVRAEREQARAAGAGSQAGAGLSESELREAIAAEGARLGIPRAREILREKFSVRHLAALAESELPALLTHLRAAAA